MKHVFRHLHRMLAAMTRPFRSAPHQIKSRSAAHHFGMAMLLALLLMGDPPFTARADSETPPPPGGHTPTDETVLRVLLPVIRSGAIRTPVATEDAFATPEDTPLTVDASEGVLANDNAPSGLPLQALLGTDTNHGALTLNSDGSFTYAPNRDYFGADSFSYRASNGVVASAPVTVTLIVTGVNDAPVAKGRSYQTPQDTRLVVSAGNGVLANDSDVEGHALEAVQSGAVSHGLLNLNPDGSFDYMPDPGFVGQDSFRYVAHDGDLASEEATVTLTVKAVNTPPTAQNDSYQAAQDAELRVDKARGVLANDSDPDGDELEATLVDDVAHGALSLGRLGAIVYTPDPAFVGQDQFTYRATDGASDSNLATVTITVNRRNRAPRILSGAIAFDTRIIGENVDETHAIVAADFDQDGDMDAAATDYVDGMILYYTNDGEGNFVESILDPDLEGAYPAHVGDVDQDGDIDLFAAGYLADVFVWYRNEGGGEFTRVDIDGATDGPHSIVTVDFDDDGDIDFVTSSQDAGTIAWYENDGAQNFTLHLIDDTALNAKRAEVADMDGDGDLDVVSAAYKIDEIAWHENDGDFAFTKHVIHDEADGAYYISPADIDGDGDMDTFAASRLDNTVAWHRNDGAAGFTEQIIDDEALHARTILAVDMDQDGDADALTTAVHADIIAWYENDGNGNFSQHIIDNDARGVYGAFYTDMDFDGDLDVLSARKDSGKVALHTHYRAHTERVNQGQTLVIDSTMLRTEDSDDGPGGLRYTLTAPPQLGELQLNGVTVPEGGTFTQADIDNARLSYAHGGANKDDDSFAFTVADGGEDGVRPAGGTFVIDIR